ncbi:MAG: uroporphyrinogen decarboxylase family protein [Gemmatimonadota bacterium]
MSAVWEAYHRRQPIRVPMVLGINVRFTMFGHEANPRGITFEQYFTDPETMLTRQLEHLSWVRRHVPQDQEMGPPAAGWQVHVDLQNSYEAGWFGCPVRYFEGEAPDTEPLLSSDADRGRLLDAGLPDPFTGGLMERNWAFYEHFRQRQAEGFTWEGLPLAGVTPAGLGTDGPLTVACNLRGASATYADLAADPGYARELLDYITEATIARIAAYRQRLGLPARTAGYGFADDAIQSISPEMYRQLVMPYHQRLIAAFSSGGPNAIHLCGDATRHFRLLRDELEMRSFDTGFPIDFAWTRRQVGPEVELKGGPSVMFLREAGPAEVEEQVRDILASGVTAGGRFVLREGNNLPPGVPLANLWAMYGAARRFGAYGPVEA